MLSGNKAGGVSSAVQERQTENFLNLYAEFFEVLYIFKLLFRLYCGVLLCFIIVKREEKKVFRKRKRKFHYFSEDRSSFRFPLSAEHT